MTPQDLLFIQTKVSNSFLRAFYSVDYRSNQRQQNKSSAASIEEVKRVRKTEKLTEDLQRKLARVLGMLEREMSNLVESLDNAKAYSAEPISLDIEGINGALQDSSMGMFGLYDLVRRLRERKRAREEERKRAKEEAKKRKAEEEAKRRAKEREEARRRKQAELEQREELRKKRAKEAADEKRAREKSIEEQKKLKGPEARESAPTESQTKPTSPEAAKPGTPEAQVKPPSTTEATGKGSALEPPQPKLGSGDVLLNPEAPKPGGSLWSKITEFGGGMAKGAYSLAEGVVIKGAVITMAVAAAISFFTELYGLLNRDDLTKSEFAKEVTKLVARLVDQIGLAWAGAAIGSFVGSGVPVAGTLVGFFTGLAAGTAIQMTVGDDVEALTDFIIEKLWPEDRASDATISPSETSVPATPSLSPISSAQASEGPSGKPASAAELQAQVDREKQGLSRESQSLAAQSMIASVSAQASAELSPAVPPPPPATAPPASELPAASPPPDTVIQPAPEGATQTEPLVDMQKVQNDINQSVSQVQSQPQIQAQTQTASASDNTATFNNKPGSTGNQSNETTSSTSIDTGTLQGENLVTLRTSSGQSYQVNAAYASNFDGFVKALEATGYQIKSIGGYANRNIAGSSKKSFHSVGAAIDINPQQNPVTYGNIITDMPEGVSQLAAQFGLGWGGDWSGKKDTMHFSAARAERGAFNVDRNSGVVALAEGGKIQPRRGGTLAIVAEAGEPEFVVPQSKVQKFAHEMLAGRPTTRTKTKKHTHVMVVPIYT